MRGEGHGLPTKAPVVGSGELLVVKGWPNGAPTVKWGVMSRLAQLIRRVMRRESAPLGFGVGARTTPPPMLVVAMVGDEQEAQRAIDQGADAIILPLEVAQALAEALRGVKVPWGVHAAPASPTQLAPLRAAGLDFLVLRPQESDAALLLAEGVGLVMEPSPTTSDLELRLLGELPLDAVLLQVPPPPLTVSQLLSVRRITYLCRQPALALVPPEAHPPYLRCLVDMGVAGAVASSFTQVEALRKAIASMPPGKRREERPEPVVPLTAVSTVPPEAPQEEPEDAS